MNPKTLRVLTVLVLLLGVLYFFERKLQLPSTDERIEQEKKVLGALEDDDVQAVTIAWDEQTVRLERREKAPASDSDDEGEDVPPETEWFLTEPVAPEARSATTPAARADKSAVTSLLRGLTGLEKERTLDAMDLAEAGLDEPRARVTLTDADGEIVLAVGAEVPGTSDMLVLVEGNAGVHQVSSSVWSDLTREPGDWRDKSLFTALSADVERITLDDGEEPVLLVRRGDELWLESPFVDRADEDLTRGLLAEITGLKAETFLDEPPEELGAVGLEDAAVVEVVVRDQAEPFRLELGAVKPGADEEGAGEDAARTHTARLGAQLVELKTRLAAELARPAAEWRSRAWTSLQVFEVEEASFEDAEGTVALRREEGDWLRGDERIPYTAASDVLYVLGDARAEEVLSREEATARGHRLEEPELRVSLTREEGGEALRLYPIHEGYAAATSEGREAVLLLAAEGVDEIREKLTELRQAEPLPEEDEEEEGGEAAEEE